MSEPDLDEEEMCGFCEGSGLMPSGEIEQHGNHWDDVYIDCTGCGATGTVKRGDSTTV